MARVLVTGASGFIGRNVVEAVIADGQEPVAWVHRESSAADLRKLGIEVHVGDVGETDAFRTSWHGLTTVIHLAAVVAPYSQAATFRVNVEATRRLAEQLGGWESPPTFLYVSSLSAAGPSTPGAPLCESDASRPRSLYGRSKLAAETALRGLADRLPITVVRPPGVIGNRDRNLLQLYKTIEWGWNVVAISKDFQYSFVHAEDLSRGILQAAQRGERLRGIDDPESPGVYYVADPEPITMVQLAEMVALSLGRTRVRHVRLPRPLCWGLAGISDAGGRFLGIRTFLNIDKMREAAAGSWVCDVGRVERLGFRVAAPLVERIRQTTAWYREHGWLNPREGKSS